MVRTISVKFDMANMNMSRMMDFEKEVLSLNNSQNELCTSHEVGFTADHDVVIIYFVSDLHTIKAINLAIKKYEGIKMSDKSSY